MNSVLSRAKALNHLSRMTSTQAAILQAHMALYRQNGDDFRAGKMTYQEYLERTKQVSIRAAGLWVASQEEEMRRRLKCACCRLPRPGKYVDGVFLCNCCRAPSPLRRANKWVT